MKLLSLEVQNLFSLGKVTVNLNSRGLVLVTGVSEDSPGGSNGAGKSSLANKSIIWILYGQTPHGLKADKVKNRHTKGKAKGIVVFEGVDGREYRIERERPSKLSLFIEGQDVSQKDSKDTQVLINRALGRDFKTFIQTDFFGQGRMMSYANLPPAGQKAVLEQILPMEDLDKWAKTTTQVIKTFQRTALTQAVLNRGSLDTVVSTTEDLLFETQQRVQQWDTQHQMNIKLLEQQLRGESTRIEAIQTKLKELREQCKELIPPYWGEEVDFIKEREQLQEKINDCTQKIMDIQTEIHKWHSKVLILDDKQTTIHSSCPTCGQAIDTETYDTLVLEQEEIAKELEAAVQKEALLTQQIGPINQVKASLQQQQRVINEKITVTLKNDQRRAELGRQIAQLEAQIGPKSDHIRVELDTLSKLVNPHIVSVEGIKVKLKDAKKKFEEADTRLTFLEEEEKHLCFWKTAFEKDLKLALFEAACPYLDLRTAFHLNALRNSQIHVEFSTVKIQADGSTKEDFCVKVWSDTGGENFDSLSGGEQQMVSFAIGLALADLAASQTSGTSQVMILDEPFSMLDEQNSESIVNYLTQLRNVKSTILLISNESHLKNLITDHIHVTKKNGVSHVT